MSERSTLPRQTAKDTSFEIEFDLRVADHEDNVDDSELDYSIEVWIFYV